MSLQTSLKNDILSKKQFGFQEGDLSQYGIIQLVDQIRSSLEKDQFMLGVLHTVDHEILITRLENWGVWVSKSEWFKSFLKNWKQFIT